MTTFAELGIPFPLFEAPASEASEYVGLASCCLCGLANCHCFVLDIGCRIVLSCPACGVDNGLDTRDRKDVGCRSCRSSILFPSVLKAAEKIQICYSCLRAGKGAIIKDTEFGMVAWEHAVQGITHGVPGLRTNEFDRVLISQEEDWYGVRTASEHLLELIRTPNFITWQGANWLFCCKRLMTYIGDWNNVLHSPYKPADPKVFFESIIDPSTNWVWNEKSKGPGGASLYVFHCKSCGRFRSNCDMD